GQRYITIEDLKKWLQLEDKYNLWAELQRWVIKPSLNEINEKSDLFVGYEPIKRVRKIIGVEFNITYEKPVKKRPAFPHKNKYGTFVKFNAQDPKFSSHEYSVYAKDCLKILDDFYSDLADVTLEDLVLYAKFLAVNQSHKSKFGKERDIWTELKKRGYKLSQYELVEIPKNQMDFVE
ncbi:replication initiation protein, partial [Haemophilus influenzae]